MSRPLQKRVPMAEEVPAASVITLTTDFGLDDIYVGVMKGVLLGIAPNARLVDLTHAIAPQNILEASLRLAAAVPYFPPGTIHLVVVDPGVGSERRAVVVETEQSRFVAPDNGVLTAPLRQNPARRVLILGEAARPYFRHPVSATFHGRDLFAPIAAHLAAGLPLESLGEPLADSKSLVEIAIPEPLSERTEAGRPALRLHVLYTDRFGNLITDLTAPRWEAWQRKIGSAADSEDAARLTIETGTTQWKGIARTFADVAVGSPLAYWGSAGHLEIAVRNGNAAQALRLLPGDTVRLIAGTRRARRLRPA